MSESAWRIVRKPKSGGLQSDAEVIDQFAARHMDLRLLLEYLRGNIGQPSMQHTLITAPSGAGKTMLLARMAAEIRTNHEFSEKLLPVRFTEDGHGIFSLADFWMEALLQLAAEVGRRDPAMAQALQESHRELSAGWRGDDLEVRAECAVLNAADELDRQLVLMVENLQSIQWGKGDLFGWKLRQVLQTQPRIIMMATADRWIMEFHDYDKPFYGFFRDFSLKPLSVEDSRLLWQSASADKLDGLAVRPLQILAGGSPRLLAGMARHSVRPPLRDLPGRLAALMDCQADSFRAQLTALPRTERRVYLAAIEPWEPPTAAEIAARARMDERTVSALLTRLVKRGALTVEADGPRRYAAQRMFSLPGRMRHEQGRAVAAGLVRFMAALYAPSPHPRIRPPAVESDDARLVMAAAHIERGVHLRDNRRPNCAAHSFDEAVRSVVNMRSVEARRMAAAAMLNKGWACLAQDYPSAAAHVFDQAAQQAGPNSPHVMATLALFSKAVAQLRMDDPHEAHHTFGVVERRCKGVDALVWRTEARAQLGRSQALLGMGRTEAALDVLGRLESDASGLREEGGPSFSWLAAWAKAAVLALGSGDADQAAGFLAVPYGGFDPLSVGMLRALTAGAIDLVAHGGLPERTLLDVLLADASKAAALEPLVIALRRRLGEAVRAAPEIDAVARDVGKAMQGKLTAADLAS